MKSRSKKRRSDEVVKRERDNRKRSTLTGEGNQGAAKNRK